MGFNVGAMSPLNPSSSAKEEEEEEEVGSMGKAAHNSKDFHLGNFMSRTRHPRLTRWLAARQPSASPAPSSSRHCRPSPPSQPAGEASAPGQPGLGLDQSER